MAEQNVIQRVEELYARANENLSKQQEEISKRTYERLPTQEDREAYAKIRMLNYKLMEQRMKLKKPQKKQVIENIPQNSRDKLNQSIAITAAKSRNALKDMIGNTERCPDECYSDLALLQKIPCPRGWQEGMTFDEYMHVLEQRKRFTEELIKHGQRVRTVMEQGQ